MADDARGIFPISTEAAAISESYNMPTGSSEIYTRGIIETLDSKDERCLYIKTTDTDASNPTLKIYIQLYNGTGWMAPVQIGTTSGYAAGSEIIVTSYGQSWWKRNMGVRFYITKTGAGAVAFTEARWI